MRAILHRRTSYSKLVLRVAFGAALLLLAQSLHLFSRPATSKFGQLQNFHLTPAEKRLTLISVYGGHKSATYMPWLVQSAAQNADSVDLLFINIDQGHGCIDFSYAKDISNFKHVCLTDAENNQLFVEWVCEGNQKGCTSRQRQMMAKHLMDITLEAQSINDEIFNTFKPWRGLIYKAHVKTEWWAWFDADQIIGNFASLIPWEILNNFDLVITDGATNAPKALFMSGQLTLFRNNAKMAAAPFDFLPLGNLDYFYTLKAGTHRNTQDEGEYADMYINRLPHVDLLRIPDVPGTEPNVWDRRLVIVDGHILNAHKHVERGDIQAYFNRLHDPDYGLRPYGRSSPAFTKYGVDIPVTINRTEINWCNGDLWNPANACPTYRPSYISTSLLMRKDSAWRIRREPRLLGFIPHDWAPLTFVPQATVHWFNMKYKGHFRLPNWEESGFADDLVRSHKYRRDGDKISVVEVTKDYWATWTMTRGAADPPRGYDRFHIYAPKTPSAEHDSEIDDLNDWSWRYHNYKADTEIQPKVPPPSNTGRYFGDDALMVWDAEDPNFKYSPNKNIA